MTYATQDDLERLASPQRLVELSDRAVPPAGVIDTAVIDAALADADALIDGYLGGRYDLPLSPVPPALRQHAATIAYYRLHIEAAPDKVTVDYREALRWLERVAAGAIVLPTAAGDAAPAEGGVRFSAADRVFSRGTLRGF